MRTLLLLAVLLPTYVVGACSATGRSGGSDDDDDDGGSTSVGGAGGGAWTTTSTATTSNTTTTTTTGTTSTTSTTTSTSTASCYAGHGECDPMQAGSCAEAGAACDVDSGSSQFVCFPPPNTAGLGAPCDPSAGPYCMHGLTCVSDGTSNRCAAYCCSTADCASCTSLGTVGSIDQKVCTE